MIEKHFTVLSKALHQALLDTFVAFYDQEKDKIQAISGHYYATDL